MKDEGGRMKKKDTVFGKEGRLSRPLEGIAGPEADSSFILYPHPSKRRFGQTFSSIAASLLGSYRQSLREPMRRS